MLDKRTILLKAPLSVLIILTALCIWPIDSYADAGCTIACGTVKAGCEQACGQLGTFASIPCNAACSATYDSCVQSCSQQQPTPAPQQAPASTRSDAVMATRPAPTPIPEKARSLSDILAEGEKAKNDYETLGKILGSEVISEKQKIEACTMFFRDYHQSSTYYDSAKTQCGQFLPVDKCSGFYKGKVDGVYNINGAPELTFNQDVEITLSPIAPGQCSFRFVVTDAAGSKGQNSRVYSITENSMTFSGEEGLTGIQNARGEIIDVQTKTDSTYTLGNDMLIGNTMKTFRTGSGEIAGWMKSSVSTKKQ